MRIKLLEFQVSGLDLHKALEQLVGIHSGTSVLSLAPFPAFNPQNYKIPPVFKNPHKSYVTQKILKNFSEFIPFIISDFRR